MTVTGAAPPLALTAGEPPCLRYSSASLFIQQYASGCTLADISPCDYVGLVRNQPVRSAEERMPDQGRQTAIVIHRQ